MCKSRRLPHIHPDKCTGHCAYCRPNSNPVAESLWIKQKNLGLKSSTTHYSAQWRTDPGGHRTHFVREALQCADHLWHGGEFFPRIVYAAVADRSWETIANQTHHTKSFGPRCCNFQRTNIGPLRVHSLGRGALSDVYDSPCQLRGWQDLCGQLRVTTSGLQINILN